MASVSTPHGCENWLPKVLFHTRSADLPRRVNKTLLGFAPLWIDVLGRRELANKDRQLCRVHFYTYLFCNIAPLPGCLTRIGIRCQNAP